MVYLILIVDDEANQRFVLEQALRPLNQNWTIVTAASGQEAITLIDDYWPDLIITDHHMPIMNGLELITNVRARGLRCPIVMITAYMSPEVAEAAKQLAIDHCLTKPVPLAQVRRLAVEALG